jgi:deoxyribodipyrimidine photolyase-related protein
MPAAFYDGTTGIEPVDTVIRRVLRHAYCHHIERLMILGNFMLLCEIDPAAIYRWFMELFIDAYDWVMVPNVYGMSQHADGGLITTKPYLSGSSYVLKMSNFTKGPWCAVWDACTGASSTGIASFSPPIRGCRSWWPNAATESETDGGCVDTGD